MKSTLFEMFLLLAKFLEKIRSILTTKKFHPIIFTEYSPLFKFIRVWFSDLYSIHIFSK